MSRTKLTGNSIAAGAINSNTFFGADVVSPHAVANTSTYSVAELLVGGTTLLDNDGNVDISASNAYLKFSSGADSFIGSGAALINSGNDDDLIIRVDTGDSFIVSEGASSTIADFASAQVTITPKTILSSDLAISTTLPTIAGETGTLVIGDSGAIVTFDGETNYAQNAYYNSGWKYRTTDTASILQMGNGDIPFRFSYAASGSADAAVTFTEAMQISAAGNLGIGIAPDAWTALKVSDSGNVYANMYAATGYLAELQLQSQNASGLLFARMDNAGTGIFGTNIATPLLFYTNNAEKMRITSAGNVGIGVTDPDHELEIRGDYQPLSVNSSTSHQAKINLRDADTTRGYIGASSTASFSVHNSSATETFRVLNSDGHVGIGTTSPNQALTIGQNSAQATLELRRTNAVSGAGQAYGSVTWAADDTHLVATLAALSDNADGNGADFVFLNTSAASSTTNYSVMTEKMRITSAGAVTLTGGIGVLGATGSDSTGSTGVKLPNEKYIAWHDSGASGNTNTHIRSNANFLELTSSKFNFVTGKVGIGISAPTAALHVYTEGSNYTHGAYLLVESANASMGGNAVFAGLKHAAAIGASYIPLKVTTAGTTLMQLGSAGQLGVGEASVTPANRSPLYHFTHDTDTGMDWVAANTLTFRTGNTERLRIASAGQFGIGGANYGTDGQVLTSQGASAAPAWEDAGGGAWTFISTSGDLSSGTTVNFTGIDDTYDMYCVLASGIGGTQMVNILMRVSTDGGSSYVSTGNYRYWHGNVHDGSDTIWVNRATTQTSMRIAKVSADAGANTSFWLYFSGAAVTGEYMPMWWNGLINGGVNGIDQHYGSGGYNQTTNVNAIQFLLTSGNYNSGRFTLYGIKHS